MQSTAWRSLKRVCWLEQAAGRFVLNATFVRRLAAVVAEGGCLLVVFGFVWRGNAGIFPADGVEESDIVGFQVVC